MPVRWLAVSNYENWEVVKKESIWGVSNHYRNTINKVKIGDTLIIYVSEQIKKRLPVAITGSFEVTSSVYEDNTKLFSKLKFTGDEIFPLRIKVKAIPLFKHPVEFKPLIPKLMFITNKIRWNGHIRGKAMRIIPEEDYELFLKMSSK